MSSMLQILVNNPSIQFTGYLGHYGQQVIGEEGVFWFNEYYIQISRGLTNHSNDFELIIADVERKKLSVMTANTMESGLVELDLSGMNKDGVVDLDNAGRHWEGEVLDGECCSPCGYGKEYNEENHLVYEGFVFEGRRVCYGKEYRGIRNCKSDNNGLMYEGGYCNGDRYGVGKSYNLNGDVEYEGEWMEGYPITESKKKKLTIKSGDALSVPSVIEELVIGENVFNDNTISVLHFSSLLIQLKRIEIRNGCFTNVREFVLDGLECLESVEIGGKCFSPPRNEEGRNTLCRIANCPNLHRLKFKLESFKNYSKFELMNVNSLESITFGQYCFWNACNCILKGG